MTIGQARRALAAAFRAAGLDSPELDARILVGYALGLDHTALVLAERRGLDAAAIAAVEALARRRLAREPVARIVGEKEFWGMALRVTPATLVPRPETETVVEAALAAVDAGGRRDRPLRIADLGTGSGALLLALLSELPGAVGVGTDISVEALRVARDNAARHNLTARAHFVACEFGTALVGGFDLVVSNPPYIATCDMMNMMPEVRHDPARALDAGPDGLDGYRAIAADAVRLTRPGGYCIVELGIGQETAVAAIMENAGLAIMPTRHDLASIPRALVAVSQTCHDGQALPTGKKALGLSAQR